MANRTQFDFSIIQKAVTKAITELPQEIAEVVKDNGIKNIKSGSFYGETWVPRKVEWSHPPLQLTGDLLKAVEDSVNKGKMHSTPKQKDTRKNFLGVVTSPYAALHNYGGGEMPARPFIEHHPQLDKQVIVMIMKKLNPKFNYIID